MMRAFTNHPQSWRREAVPWFALHTSLTSKQVADVLGTYDGYVRRVVLDYKRRSTPSDFAALAHVGNALLTHRFQRERLLELSPLSLRDGAAGCGDLTDFSALEAEINKAVDPGDGPLDFEEAIARLNSLGPRLGRFGPSNESGLSAAGRRHKLLAWCFVHLGLDRSAARHALLALDQYARLYGLTGSPKVMKRLADVALTASNAMIGACEWQRASLMLTVFKWASRIAANTTGGEFHRQSAIIQVYAGGVPRFDDARGWFRGAMTAMKAARESTDLVEIAMWGQRYLNWIDGRWDTGALSALELDAAARKRWGRSSLQASAARLSAVACGLRIDDRPIRLHALDLLREYLSDIPAARKFPKQFAVASFLRCVERLPKEVGVGDVVAAAMRINPMRYK